MYARKTHKQEEEQKKSRSVVGLVCGTVIVWGAIIGAVVVAPPAFLVGLSVMGAAGASAGTLATSVAVGGSIGGYIGFSMKSEIWEEKTEKFRYNAPKGHQLAKDKEPSYDVSGQGHVKIVKTDKDGFDYEITALQGKVSVKFTSYEVWVNKSKNGQFKNPKSMFEYIDDIQTEIEKIIKADETGKFDVIKFLRDKRSK